jgi:hypothetical protein
VRRHSLLVGLFAAALVVSACGGNNPSDSTAPTTASGSSAPTSAPSASGGATSSPTTSTSATPSDSGAPTATASGSGSPSATAASCTPGTPTALSANWSKLQAHDNDYSFKFPATWDKLYGAFVFNTSSLLDPQTFAETGLPATSETRADLVRAPGVGLPNASVLIVPGVTSNTATVFARQVERFKSIADIHVLSSTLTACLGGEEALGVSFTFNKDTTYQESWYLVHAGRSYDFQWLAPKGQEQTDTFKEMFATWEWAPNIPVATPLPSVSTRPSASASASGSPSAATTSFVLAGMATKVDTAATSANPKDFLTTVPKETTALYAVFALKPGLQGQVNGALKQGDKVLVTLSLQYGPKNTWGDFRINSANGIAPGSYVMLIEYVPSGETIQIPFTVK